MAFDFSDLMGTPQGYATPEQLAQARQLFGGMQKPQEGAITHPMQTVGDIFKNAVGALGQNQVNSMQRAAMQRAAGNSNIDAPGGAGGAVPYTGVTGPGLGFQGGSGAPPPAPPTAQGNAPMAQSNGAPPPAPGTGGIPTPPQMKPTPPVGFQGIQGPGMGNSLANFGMGMAPLSDTFKQRFGALGNNPMQNQIQSLLGAGGGGFGG